MAEDEKADKCEHKDLLICSYQVANANTCVELARDVDTGKVVDFDFNRIDGEVGEVDFYCGDCGEYFTWEQVLGF